MAWNYAGRLGPIAAIAPAYPLRRGGLAMKDGVAMTITDRWRIWGRSGETWTLQPVAGIAPTALTGPDIEIDGGRILAARFGCTFDAVVLRKFGTAWMPEGELPGHGQNCTPETRPTSLDIQGDRAAVVNLSAGFYPYWGQVRIFRPNTTGVGWHEYAQLGISENERQGRARQRHSSLSASTASAWGRNSMAIGRAWAELSW